MQLILFTFQFSSRYFDQCLLKILSNQEKM